MTNSSLPSIPQGQTPDPWEALKLKMSYSLLPLTHEKFCADLDALLAAARQQQAVEKVGYRGRPSAVSDEQAQTMKQGRYYGRPLIAEVKDGQLVIAIGVQTLAHAITYADWANPFNKAADDYIRDFAISDAPQYAKDVVAAMLSERENGSTPLSDFLDMMALAAVEDGSLGLCEDTHQIKHGETAPCETWTEGTR